jgi:hypothetical protein
MKKLFAVLIAFQLMIIPIPAQAKGMTSQLTGIAIGAVGVSLAAACKLKSPSLLMYIAGAAVYLMGEMNGGKAQKKQLEDTNKDMDELSKKGEMGGEVQLASLEAQLKDKEEKLKLAQKRSKWAGAAQMMFLAAAAMAAVEILPESLGTLPPLGCDPGSAMALGKVKSAAVVAGYTFMTGGGLTGALMGALAGFVVAQGALSSVFNTAMGRVAGMAVVAGLTMMAKKEVDGEVKKLEDDIADLKKVIAQFRKETDGTGPNSEDVTGGASSGSTTGALAGTTSGATGGVSSGGGSGVTPLPGGKIAGGTNTCLNSNQEFSNNCSNPMKFTSPDLKMFGDQPELQQVANQGIQMANDATSGNVGRADIAAGSLNSQAAKMNDALKKSLAKTNSKLKSQGKSAIDLEKSKQDVLKSMQAAFDKETAGQQNGLAALGIGGMTLDPNAVDKSGQNIAGASTTAAVAVPTSDGKAADAVAPTESTAAITAEASKAAEESAASALGKNLGDYESTDGDISAKKEDSLWKQVSNRYLLNYGRFFERNKLPSQ